MYEESSICFSEVASSEAVTPSKGRGGSDAIRVGVGRNLSAQTSGPTSELQFLVVEETGSGLQVRKEVSGSGRSFESNGPSTPLDRFLKALHDAADASEKLVNPPISPAEDENSSALRTLGESTASREKTPKKRRSSHQEGAPKNTKGATRKRKFAEKGMEGKLLPTHDGIAVRSGEVPEPLQVRKDVAAAALQFPTAEKSARGGRRMSGTSAAEEIAATESASSNCSVGGFFKKIVSKVALGSRKRKKKTDSIKSDEKDATKVPKDDEGEVGQGRVGQRCASDMSVQKNAEVHSLAQSSSEALSIPPSTPETPERVPAYSNSPEKRKGEEEDAAVASPAVPAVQRTKESVGRAGAHNAYKRLDDDDVNPLLEEYEYGEDTDMKELTLHLTSKSLGRHSANSVFLHRGGGEDEAEQEGVREHSTPERNTPDAPRCAYPDEEALPDVRRSSSPRGDPNSEQEHIPAPDSPSKDDCTDAITFTEEAMPVHSSAALVSDGPAENTCKASSEEQPPLVCASQPCAIKSRPNSFLMQKDELAVLRRLERRAAELEAELADADEVLTQRHRASLVVEQKKRRNPQRIHRPHDASRKLGEALPGSTGLSKRASTNAAAQGNTKSYCSRLQNEGKAHDTVKMAPRPPQRNDRVSEPPCAGCGSNGQHHVEEKSDDEHLLEKVCDLFIRHLKANGSEMCVASPTEVLRDDGGIALLENSHCHPLCHLRRWYYHEGLAAAREGVSEEVYRHRPYCLRPSCSACSPQSPRECVLLSLLAEILQSTSASGDVPSAASAQQNIQGFLCVKRVVREELYEKTTEPRYSEKKQENPAEDGGFAFTSNETKNRLIVALTHLLSRTTPSSVPRTKTRPKRNLLLSSYKKPHRPRPVAVREGKISQRIGVSVHVDRAPEENSCITQEAYASAALRSSSFLSANAESEETGPETLHRSTPSPVASEGGRFPHHPVNKRKQPFDSESEAAGSEVVMDCVASSTKESPHDTPSQHSIVFFENTEASAKEDVLAQEASSPLLADPQHFFEDVSTAGDSAQEPLREGVESAATTHTGTDGGGGSGGISADHLVMNGSAAVSGDFSGSVVVPHSDDSSYRSHPQHRHQPDDSALSSKVSCFSIPDTAAEYTGAQHVDRSAGAPATFTVDAVTQEVPSPLQRIPQGVQEERTRLLSGGGDTGAEGGAACGGVTGYQEELAEPVRAERGGAAFSIPSVVRSQSTPLSDAVPSLGLGSTTSPMPEAAEDVSIAMMEKLCELEARLVTRLPNYFEKGRDERGRPMAVLRRDPVVRHLSPRSVPMSAAISSGADTASHHSSSTSSKDAVVAAHWAEGRREGAEMGWQPLPVPSHYPTSSLPLVHSEARRPPEGELRPLSSEKLSEGSGILAQRDLLKTLIALRAERDMLRDQMEIYKMSDAS